MFYNSCRKVDALRQETPHSVGDLENKFFNSHRSANITEKAIVDFIKRKNDKEHFIEKQVNKLASLVGTKHYHSKKRIHKVQAGVILKIQ